MQNNCLRNCYKRNQWPGTIKAHTNNGLQFLEDRRTVYLCQRGLEMSKDQAQLKTFSYNSRRANKYLLDTYRSHYKVIDKSPTHRIVNTWNHLPEFMRNFRIDNLMARVLPTVLWAIRLKNCQKEQL